jgi:hypothetical protein
MISYLNTDYLALKDNYIQALASATSLHLSQAVATANQP